MAKKRAVKKRTRKPKEYTTDTMKLMDAAIKHLAMAQKIMMKAKRVD